MARKREKEIERDTMKITHGERLHLPRTVERRIPLVPIYPIYIYTYIQRTIIKLDTGGLGEFERQPPSRIIELGR